MAKDQYQFACPCCGKQIELDTTDGARVDTRAFRGQKHFVLITGAIT